MTRDEVARLLDATLLAREATERDVEALCADAVRARYAGVVVFPCFLPRAVRLLEGSGVAPIAPVGFPFGASFTRAKIVETEEALGHGAREIDVVMNAPLFLSGEEREVAEELREVIVRAHGAGALAKVILETGVLDDEARIVRAAELAVAAGADVVKTSTGVACRGATVRDVELLRKTTPPRVGVKASGGIRTLAQVEAMVGAGATRIGTSAAREIVAEVMQR